LPEVKEHAAQGLGEVIRLTSAIAAKRYTHYRSFYSNPDRFNWSVKAAVLETLAILLGRHVKTIFATTANYFLEP